MSIRADAQESPASVGTLVANRLHVPHFCPILITQNGNDLAQPLSNADDLAANEILQVPGSSRYTYAH